MKPKKAANTTARTSSENNTDDYAVSLLQQCCEVRKNNAKRWKEIIADLDFIFPQIKERALKTKILFEKAHFYYMAEGAFQRSIDLCNEAKKLFNSNELDFEITFQSLLGTNYHLMGNYEKAQPHYLTGIELLENKLEKSIDDLDALAKLYYNTGLLYTNLTNKESSINYVQKALDIYSKINHKSGLARCYNALGHHHPQSQQNEKISIEYYIKAAQYFQEDNDLIGLATAFNNIGYKYGMLKQIESALEYLEKSIEIRKKLGNKKGMAASFFYMGSVLESNGMYDDAIIHYQNAEKLLLEINSKHELHSLYEQLSKTFAHKKNFQQAYQYHKLYTKLKEEIFNFDYKTSLSIEESKLLIEQQEREAKFERQKQQELSEYIKKLEEAQNELMQMVFIASHDLREPIRMITSYSLLLSKEESLQNETLNNAAREICNTTLNMWNTLKKLQQSAQNKVYKN